MQSYLQDVAYGTLSTVSYTLQYYLHIVSYGIPYTICYLMVLLVQSDPQPIG